jgi:F-type H+-transporting ATPase subunit delta
MDEGKISVRYAEALYALAEEKGLHQELYLRLEQLTQAFLEVSGLGKHLTNPMHSKTDKLELLVAASGCEKASLLADFFLFVLDKGREEFMVFIAMSYQRIYREKQRIVTGTIISALPLQEGSLERIHKLVDQQFNATIELEAKVDPEILGGFILEVDNYRMDSSIQSELEHVRTELMRV